MDPYILLALITSASSLIVSVLTHVKHSKCWNCEIETRDSPQSQENERKPLIETEPPARSRSGSTSTTRVTFLGDKTIQFSD